MCINKEHDITSVYLPTNEPYLGRELVFHFDQTIISCLEINADIAAYTHNAKLSDIQKAACQIIPQGINLSLTIRELVRQGYLFGAIVLMRPLIERAAIISYLHANPDKVNVWQRGWQYGERPPLSTMLETMSGNADIKLAKQICEDFNHIVHGDPVGSQWNLVNLSNGGLGYSVGKVINDPDLCDFICAQSYCYLIVLMGRMAGIFPEVNSKKL
ncbi:hypothetical protein HZA73_05490 [candidate division TA06 bacterium]|nr:hypothetical protein [candidate division TA06 bacterium]